MRLYILALGLVLTSAVSWVHATPPPEEYDDSRKDAQEAIIIKVLSVKEVDNYLNISAEVEVLAVERSKSKLQPGQKVEIRYRRSRQDPSQTGPGDPPLLQAKRVYPAFLNKASGGGYRPAAYDLSFYMTPLIGHAE